MRKALVLTVVAACFVLPRLPESLAHEQLKSPPPRANMEANQKIAPCGNLPRSPKPFVAKPGATLKVEWTQTIHHPGWFRISFRTSEAGDFTKNVLIDKVASVNKVNDGNATIQLPNMECDTCTLHLAQIMTDQPDKTVASGYKEYNACADLILTLDDPPAGGTSTGTTTTGAAAETTGGSQATGSTGGSGDGGGNMPAGGCSAVDPSPYLLLGALCVLTLWKRRAA